VILSDIYVGDDQDEFGLSSMAELCRTSSSMSAIAIIKQA